MSTTPGADLLGVVAMVLLLVGALLSLSAAIGLVRFPDVLSRLHPATKPQVLGVLLVLVAVGLRVGLDSPDLGMLVVTALAQLLTIPVAAHMVGRAVYRTERLQRSDLAIDELSEADARDAEASDRDETA